MAASPIAKLALVVGGGPAPGINGVISAVTIEALNTASRSSAFRTASSGWSTATPT